MSEQLDKSLGTREGLQQLISQLDLLDEKVSSGTDIAGAAGGAAVGAAGSFAALYGLGVTGLSAAGITSGLAAAGALVGGGMVAGIGVLAAPVALLAVGGYAVFNHRKQAEIKRLQRDALNKAISKQNAILLRLKKRGELSSDIIGELDQRNAVLEQVIHSLRKKIDG